MINRPNKPSYDFAHLIRAPQFYRVFLIGLFLFLVSFFAIAAFFQLTLFVYLVFILLFCIVFLITEAQQWRHRKQLLSIQKDKIIQKIDFLKTELARQQYNVEALDKTARYYSHLEHFIEGLNNCFLLADTSKFVSSHVDRMFGESDTTAALFIFYSKTGDIGVSTSQKGNMQINLKSKKGDSYDRWVVKNMQPLFVPDAAADSRFQGTEHQPSDRPIGSLISIPLIAGDRMLGILRVDTPQSKFFLKEDVQFLSTIAGLSAVAVENAQLYEHVEDLAIKDGLTGLYLRKHLLERLSEEILRYNQTGKEFSLLLMDLDHFKEYNDTFGHIAGDMVLRTTAMLLAEQFHSPGDVVSRYGGEEFCVLLPDCSKKNAQFIAEEFRKRLEQHTIILRRQKTQITVSIGVAAFPTDAKTQEELIHVADQAMYQAKNSGRNRVATA